MLRFRSYAKINWFLEVLNRRPDGYTNIETLFQSVSLFDELSFEPAGSLQFTCSQASLSGDENLVLRAARLLQVVTGCTDGAAITLDKQIPVAAGLAGGSGNAAATLLALNELWSLDLDRETLFDLALQLGSDVPFCMTGGAAIATGRGEELVPIEHAPSAWLVLVHPPIEVSAASVYNHPRLERSREAPQFGRTPTFQRAIDAFERGAFANAMFNRMEPVVLYDHPGLSRLRERLIELGCEAAQMSGSGPTFFGLCRSEIDAHRVAKEIRYFPAYVVHTVSEGVERLA